MSVTENLEMGAFQRKDKGEFKDDMDRVFELFPRLAERRHQKAGTMSGGEQQMCAIGRALMARPTLLMLDEPSMGLAPIFVERIFETIVEVNKQGTSILLVEQNALMALDVANRGYVLETGHVALADDAKALAQNARGAQDVPRRDVARSDPLRFRRESVTVSDTRRCPPMTGCPSVRSAAFRVRSARLVSDTGRCPARQASRWTRQPGRRAAGSTAG